MKLTLTLFKENVITGIHWRDLPAYTYIGIPEKGNKVYVIFTWNVTLNNIIEIDKMDKVENNFIHFNNEFKDLFKNQLHLFYKTVYLHSSKYYKLIYRLKPNSLLELGIQNL